MVEFGMIGDAWVETFGFLTIGCFSSCLIFSKFTVMPILAVE
jgi:hypothetical protein